MKASRCEASCSLYTPPPPFLRRKSKQPAIKELPVVACARRESQDPNAQPRFRCRGGLISSADPKADQRRAGLAEEKAAAVTSTSHHGRSGRVRSPACRRRQERG
ncbi:hypothetical protein MRX96_051743 [Rhipicephalus microplus]